MPYITSIQSDIPNRYAHLIDLAFSESDNISTSSKLDIYSIEGTAGRKYRKFINTLLMLLGSTSYLEIGSGAGSALCAAISGNQIKMAVAIDTWSQAELLEQSFHSNLKKFNTENSATEIIKDDFRTVSFSDLRARLGGFQVYLYDGPHDNSTHEGGLDCALPLLDGIFIFICCDWNWAHVRSGIYHAIRENNIDFLHTLEIRTTIDNSDGAPAGKESDWNNGYFIGVLQRADATEVVSIIPSTIAFPSAITADELITSAYNSLLGRRPDPTGLLTFRQLFGHHGLAPSLEYMLSAILSSSEFEGRWEQRTKLSSQPVILTAYQAEQLSTIMPKDSLITRDSLVTSFSAVVKPCPTFYLYDHLQKGSNRTSVSIDYMTDLIMNYISGAHRSCSTSLTPESELGFVVQIGDRAEDKAGTAAYCAPGNNVTLIPDPHFWTQQGYSDHRKEIDAAQIDWRCRHDSAFWRGSTTGAYNITVASLDELPRYRLCSTGKKISDILNAKFTTIAQAADDGEIGSIRQYLLTQDLLDTEVPQINFMQYKYLIDIDGNSNAWGLLLKLMMGSCVLKVMSEWRQWYYAELKPWEHYVPIKTDLSDLEERISWCLDHDTQAREIACNGMQFANAIDFNAEMRKAARRILELCGSAAGEASRRTIYRTLRSS